jgi:hypothetical protein
MNNQRALAGVLIAMILAVIPASVIYAAHGGGHFTTTTTTTIAQAPATSYSVQYVSGVNFNPTTLGYPYNITTLALKPGFTDYYWTASAAVDIATHNYTVDEYAQPQYNPPVNGSDAGHSSASTGTISQSQPNAQSNDFQGILAGMGADLPFSNAQTTLYANNGPLRSKSVTHTYTVTQPGSFTIIDVSGGSANMAHFTSISVPSTCTVLEQYMTSFSNGSVGLEQAVCPDQAAGTYDISWSVSGKQEGVTTAAYTFAPYTVTLAVNQSGAGTIETDYQNTASGTISVIGTGSIAAIAAPGYTFSHWVVSDPANLIVGNATSYNTTLTVLGPGTITADFV